jgi:hypothetical protein
LVFKSASCFSTVAPPSRAQEIFCDSSAKRAQSTSEPALAVAVGAELARSSLVAVWLPVHGVS